jgi:hypothetical protein
MDNVPVRERLQARCAFNAAERVQQRCVSTRRPMTLLELGHILKTSASTQGIIDSQSPVDV